MTNNALIDWETWKVLSTNSAQLSQSKNVVRSIIWKLEELWVNDEKLAATIEKLLDAKTLNNKWDEMQDNKTILETLKLVLKMHGAKLTDTQINIAIFQSPAKDSKLEY